jgi:hypothetical protein
MLRRRSSNIELMSGRLSMEGKANVKAVVKDLDKMMNMLEEAHFILTSKDEMDEALIVNSDVSKAYDALEKASSFILLAVSSLEKASR